ncbi:hypothetical protein [Natronomonas salsuginis]|uniref:Uncharacterized protein n=1 Tax=Natronomonas salsuginis TaxID=2217661 RepID=A0A4U5JH42_9EURY|nr:hypothetical protein [Natronomonas salsuginis]TKR27776.1 hypothetical protein DM868_01410 [Natronomonas salsuginis]
MRVSDAIVAFIVGAAFGQTSHVRRIETLIALVRDIFAAVFCSAIGSQTDPRLVVSVVESVLSPVITVLEWTTSWVNSLLNADSEIEWTYLE